MSHPIPILEIGPILVSAIQIELNDRVVADFQESLLARIKATGASAVLIDITVVETVDTYIARALSETARMAAIMNARVVLIGMQPAVVITLLEMGLKLPDVQTALGIEAGLAALGYRLEPIAKRAA